MLEIRNLTRKYVTRTAVDDLSLTVKPGETWALLGPNGSGKTTLMKMIAGLVQPTKGEILLDGEPIGTATKARVAYMPTENYFYNYMTIGGAGRYYRDFFRDFDDGKFARMLSDMDLSPKDKIRALSSGMSAKLRLALTLSRDAELMMFDEPLNGVDILTRTQVIAAIDAGKKEGRMMLVSTHLVEEIEEELDCAVYIRRGKNIRAGSVAELTKDKTLTELYLEIYGAKGAEEEC